MARLPLLPSVLLLAFLSACGEKDVLVAPEPPVADLVRPIQVTGASGYDLVWQSRGQFPLSSDAVCDPAYEYLPNGLMAYAKVVSGWNCAQYTNGVFRIVPRSGNPTAEPVNVNAIVTQSGTGQGCSSVNSLQPWVYLLEACNLANGTYPLQLLTNTSYRMETNAAGYAADEEYRSVITLDLPPQVITVSVQVMPGAEMGSWQCRNAKGLVPVAVLSDASFDATTIDANTVRFGKYGDEAEEVHRDGAVARRHEEDVNGDGLTDLVLHFRFGDTGFTCGAVQAMDGKSVIIEGELTGRTVDGTPVVGNGQFRLLRTGRD